MIILPDSVSLSLSLLLLFSFSQFLATNGQVLEMKSAFDQLYQEAMNKYGYEYLEGIEFIQPKYNYKAIDGEEFDFIVVGSGPAGCVLTHRLSENRDYKVLLLEAGEESTYFNDIPIALPSLSSTKYNWNYQLEKDPSFGHGLVNETVRISRGKGLGGTTVINFMLYTRGNKEEYNEIEKMGVKGWSWKDVEPHFKSIENTQLEFQDYEFRGHTGLVNCGEYKNRSIVSDAWVEAFQENGWPYVDFNGRSQIGTSYAQVTSRNGLRLSAEKAYLRPIKNRPNLKILTNSFVTKVLFNKNNEAIGVEFTRNGRKYVVKANKEVILSAGTLNSPQLLLLSGIGPKKDLQKLGIKTIYDSPVGKTVYDHLAYFGLIFECREPVTLKVPETLEMDELVGKGTGNLANPLVDSLTFIDTKNNTLNGKPDIEYAFLSGPMTYDLRTCFGISEDTYEKFYKKLEDKNTFTPVIIHLHPKATGRVSLRSSNPFDSPKLQYPFLNNQEDIQAFIKAIRVAMEVVKQQPMRKYGCKQISEIIPGCEGFKFNSDDYWECGLRSLAVSVFHETASTRMGPKWDKEAIVDNKGRVYGVKKLRVADPGIIPVSISAHPTIPSYMIGEKIAYEIKKEYLIKNSKEYENNPRNPKEDCID